MLLTRLESDPSANLRKSSLYCTNLSSKKREELINLAINKADEEINERVVALRTLRDRLQELPDSSPEKSLTDEEVQKLYQLINDEAEFPIVVYSDQFTVEEITHEKNHEDSTYKSKIIKAIEENDALLRAEAVLLIVDFGQNTKKYHELKHRLVTAITAILGNMLGEPKGIFVKDKPDLLKSDISSGYSQTLTKLFRSIYRTLLNSSSNPNSKKNGTSDDNDVVSSDYFKRFVEALYFIDKQAADHFMKFFNIKENDFNPNRRNKHCIAS